MQTKHLCALINVWTKGKAGVLLNLFKLSIKIFYWPFQDGASFVDHLCYFWRKRDLSPVWNLDIKS